MPDRLRYAREKTRLAEQGTTPSLRRAESAQRRRPGISRGQAYGKPAAGEPLVSTGYPKPFPPDFRTFTGDEMGLLSKTGLVIVQAKGDATRSRIGRFDRDVAELLSGRITTARYNAAWRGRQIAGVKLPSARQVQALAREGRAHVPQVSPGVREAA